MFVVVLCSNSNGKIELTKEELQKMLDDAYNKGYSEGTLKSYDKISIPSYPIYYSNAEPNKLEKYEVTC